MGVPTQSGNRPAGPARKTNATKGTGARTHPSATSTRPFDEWLSESELSNACTALHVDNVASAIHPKKMRLSGSTPNA